ncbi:MAG: metal-dependent hydrolase [Sulfolobales archaeon]|nr:metal-dependent hydrolase [Sulfolobales archaeon]MCX8209159.1 metal-dependent hydrolase [Sulfolobales archaeon]MDW8010757.1 metal-dependent hydrolase [Sulfolobales archaeon]
MRGAYHVALHAYYALLYLAFLYGDRFVASTNSLDEFLKFLESLAQLEVVLALLVFMDIARAPDCDISCRSTVLGFLAHIPVKPFLRSHRGWYHSLWAATYVSAASSAIVAAAAYSLRATVGLLSDLSVRRLAAVVFSSSLLSYALHLVEDSLTRRGIDWFGTKIRGPAVTGRSDLYYTVVLVALSASTLLLVYMVTGTLSTSSLAGGAALAATYALLVLSRRR